MGNKSFFQFIQIILLTLSAVGVLSPIKSQAQEIDYLALAHVLLRDGNYQRAQGALANAKKDWDLIEVQNYYLLNGLYLLRTKKFNEAEAELAKVTDEDYLPQKWAYLTEVYLAQNKKGEALKSIGHFVTHKDSAPSLFH
ncbi:MAG: hypothetical protein KDD61_18325, partial [Bdellovibrionales bacterium]|nr:hypothetical protein [Bdellovibrionales bacterium]